MAPAAPGEIEGQGRWTPREHGIFMAGLKQRPSISWKEISIMVKTRSARQTRTHAQKYFQKLARHQRREEKKRRKAAGGSVGKEKKKNPQTPKLSGNASNAKDFSQLMISTGFDNQISPTNESAAFMPMIHENRNHSSMNFSEGSKVGMLPELDESCLEALKSVFPSGNKSGGDHGVNNLQMPRKLDLETFETQFFQPMSGNLIAELTI